MITTRNTLNILDAPDAAQVIILASNVHHTYHNTGYCALNVTLSYPPAISGSRNEHEHHTSVDVVMCSVP